MAAFYLSTPAVVAGLGFSAASVCLSACLSFRTTSQKPTQLGLPNLTWKCSSMGPGQQFILGSKGQGHAAQKHGFLHSLKCLLLQKR